MKSIAVFAIATAFSAGSATSQVNMQYSGQVSERYSGQYSGQWTGQVNGRADGDKSQNCKFKRIAPVDRTHINYAQSMDAVVRPLLEQREPRY